jgi:hypothetical protein
MTRRHEWINIRIYVHTHTWKYKSITAHWQLYASRTNIHMQTRILTGYRGLRKRIKGAVSVQRIERVISVRCGRPMHDAIRACSTVTVTIDGFARKRLGLPFEQPLRYGSYWCVWQLAVWTEESATGCCGVCACVCMCVCMLYYTWGAPKSPPRGDVLCLDVCECVVLCVWYAPKSPP